MTDADIDLTRPRPTEAERLADAYRIVRLSEVSVQRTGDADKIAATRIALVQAADALMAEVLNYPSGRPATSAVAWTDPEGNEWLIEDGVRCVIAPCCAFTFSIDHVEMDGTGFTCPNCEPADKQVAGARIRALREAAGWVNAFDQDQTGWEKTFERQTVRDLAQGLRTMAEAAEKRQS